MTESDTELLLGRATFDSGEEGASPWRVALRKGRSAAMQAAAQAHGDFALAIRGEGGKAFLAVDRFGARSLCYRIDGSRLEVAERADQLAAPGAELDLQSLFHYLYFHAIPSPRTVFAGVMRLPPGHALWFENGQAIVSPYWKPVFSETRDPSFEALRTEFRQVLHDSVARSLDGSKPACFLSGGTDSSTVAGLIGEVTGRPASTYSIGFEAEGYDEMAFARIAARRFSTEHHEYYVTPDDLVRSIPAVAAHGDQPFGNSSVLPSYYCALQARGDGVTRLLAGDGGDELFGGNSRYAKQRVFDAYSAVPRLVRRAVLEPVFGLPLVAHMPVLKKGASYIEQARVPMPDRTQMYNLILRMGVSNVLTPQALASLDLQGPLAQQREVWAAAGDTSELNKTLAFDWRFTLAESDLPKVRCATSLAGVEVAYPMLDRALLDFSLGLPADYKLRGLRLRWFFKEALRGFLPDEIIVKKKQGFGLPFGVWANRHSRLYGLAVDSLRSLAARGFVRAEFVQALIETHLPEHPGYYGEMVWILMMLEQWLRAHAPDWRLEA
jgi:asparagine synthase (glutamine-hydrolysing)